MDDANQTLTDWQAVEKINETKESLKTLPWEQIKNNRDIIAKTIDESADADPARMIMMERTFCLSKLFQNYHQIPPQKATKVLEFIANYDFQKGSEANLQELSQIVPDLQFNALDSATFAELQKDSSALINGLSNLKKIAALKVVDELSADITNAKKIPVAKLQEYLEGLDKLAQEIMANLDKGNDLTKEQITAGIEFLKKIGHLGLGVEKFSEPGASLELINSLQKTKHALQIVLKAHEENKLNLLNDREVLMGIAIEVLST